MTTLLQVCCFIGKMVWQRSRSGRNLRGQVKARVGFGFRFFVGWGFFFFSQLETAFG